MSIDYPSTPERPTIVTVGPNSVDLSWKIPESNGGTPLVEYKIEYMVRFYCVWNIELTLKFWRMRKTISYRHILYSKLVQERGHTESPTGQEA